MVEILKINTPIATKNAIPPSKQINETGSPFDLQEISKVIKPTNQADIHKQNTGLTQRDTSTILTNLLKNLSVTVSFLKNIYMLQEIIKLLPMNNQTTIQELRGLFDELLISPEGIVNEILLQKNSSTMFRGELFDFLRELIANNPSEDVTQGVVKLLRSINANVNRQDVLDSIANNLKYLGEILEPSKSLSDVIKNLGLQFREQDASERFNQLKSQVFDVIKSIEDSILFTSQLEKVVSILTYNMSRFNSNKEFFRDSVNTLTLLINGSNNKDEFLRLVEEYVDLLSTSNNKQNTSKIMDVLSQIISKQAENSDLKLLSSDTIERIVHSLLSSPCNFTPLLHLVIPVQYLDIKSFAEVWIDPNAKGEKFSSDDNSQNVHMLVVFDIESLGSFELEVFAQNKSLSLTLLCPKAYVNEFKFIENKFEAIVLNSPYKLEEIEIGQAERPRSLMDVFKTLPYKRTGVDVRI